MEINMSEANPTAEVSETIETEAKRKYPVTKYIILGSFVWIVCGISLIYGLRIWHDSPPHPSFAPIIGAAFAAALAFTTVLMLEVKSGPIDLSFAGNHFKGSSGQIVLWCLVFLTIVFGLYLVGFTESMTVNVEHTSVSMTELIGLATAPDPAP